MSKKLNIISPFGPKLAKIKLSKKVIKDINQEVERIILNENTNLSSVVAFGGEEAIPAVHGKVYIAIKPQGELIPTATLKDEIKNSIKSRTMLGIDPIIIDPTYLYVIPTITACGKLMPRGLQPQLREMAEKRGMQAMVDWRPRLC